MPSSDPHADRAADVTLRVHDMTCGHCATAIKRAIEKSIPGTAVSADPSTKLVSVTGASDVARLTEILAKAGYTAAAA